MNLAENQVDAGVDSIPLPEKLFTLNHKAIEERDEDTESVTSDDILKANEELLVIRRGEQTEVYKLPPRGDVWDKEDECLSSSIETLSESSTSINEENYEVDNDTVELAESIASNSEDYYNFYKPDMRTPPRFKGSQSGEGSESYISLVPSAKEVVRKSNEPAGDGVWKLVPKKIPKGPCPSRVFEIDSDGEDYQPTAKEKEELVRQAWFEYYLWRLRRSNLEEEKRLTEEFPPEIQHMELEESEKLREAIFEKLNNKSEERKKIEENIFINNCVLMAIKEFVLDYFRESFQFNLIRWAYRGQHHLLTQELNRDWHIPKAFKGELKRPLSKKKKKEKPKKKPQLEKTKKVKEEKKEKKDKKEKKEKKGEKRGTSGGESGGRDDAKQEKKGKKKSKSDVESSGKDDDKKEKKGKKKGKSDGESSGKDDAKQEKKGKKMSKSDVASSGKDEDKKEMKSKKKGKSDGESSAKDDEKQEKKAKKKGKSVRESSGKDEELKEKKVKKRDTSDREISGTVGEKKDKKKGKDKKSSKGSEGKERYEEVKEGIAKTTKDNKGAKKSQKDEKAQKLQEEDKEQVVVDEPPQKTASAKLTPIRMVSDQLLREAKLKEAEEIQNEENRNYIFPLTKAVDNTFFQKIFVDWVAPRSKSTERIGSKVTIDDSGETKKKEKKREKKDVDKKSKDDKNEDEKEKDKKAKGKKEKKGTSDKRDGTGERGKKEKAKKSEKSSEKKSKKSEKGGKKKNKK